jgi:uncharacterized protein (TIGR00255 family)
MTGYAGAEAEIDACQLAWELRSVNHRYLDVSFRLPEELRSLEPRCKDLISTVVRRGKVDATLKLARTANAAPPSGLDESALTALLELQSRVMARCPDARPLSASDIMRWPGVLVDVTRLPDGIEAAALECLDAALRSLKAARDREGARLADVLGQRCAGIRQIVAEIRPRLADIGQRYRDKLMERLERFDLELEPERLEQEVALMAQRLDVAEELDRLDSHVLEVETTLQKDEAIGRRLDFIIQELNREANTFASKIQDEALGKLGVELKVLIEQMREQVQNLE